MNFNWKEMAKTAGICLAVVWAYHNDALNFVPGFKGVKGIKGSSAGEVAVSGNTLVFKPAA